MKNGNLFSWIPCEQTSELQLGDEKGDAANCALLAGIHPVLHGFEDRCMPEGQTPSTVQ
jgi:hypothetical protein